MTTTQKVKSKKAWIIPSIILLIAISLVAYKSDYVNTVYYNLLHNHYKTGDKIFASDIFMSAPKKGKTRRLSFDRLIKNESPPYDIKTQYMCGGIERDSLLKFKTALLGTYIDHQYVTISYNGETLTHNLYAIEPNWKIIDSTKINCFTIKKGYKLLDNRIYISGFTNYIK